MAETSPRMLWTYPEQHQDPWWDAFVDFIRAVDASGFAAREDRNLILGGGGDLTWVPGTTGLTWSEDFIVFSPSTGFFSRITAATLAPADGQVIRAEITRHPGQNVNVAAEIADIAQNTDNSLVLGIRIGTNFVFRNGFLIQNGTIISAIDFFSGGGGGGGSSSVAFFHGPVVTSAASPYSTIVRETVKVNPVGGVVVTLPLAAGNSGQKVKVVNVTTDTTPITVNPQGAETIDGAGSYIMSTSRERVEVESDGSDWIVVG